MKPQEIIGEAEVTAMMSSYSAMYALGKSLIEEACSVILEQDLQCKATCFHRLMKRANPEPCRI